MQAQKIAVGPPQSQEMSAQLLVANSSNYPSGSVPVSSLLEKSRTAKVDETSLYC